MTDEDRQLWNLSSKKKCENKQRGTSDEDKKDKKDNSFLGVYLPQNTL